MTHSPARRTLIVLLLFCVTLTIASCSSGNFGSTVESSGTTSTTTLAVSATSVTAGTSITFTATVSPLAAGGSVTFLDGTTSLGSAPVTAGRATLTLSSLANGTHSISASYSGATGYYASSSAAVAISVSPMLSTSSITLTASPAGATVGTNIVFIATVTSGATGIVTFFDGTTSLGTATLTASTATYSTPLLSAGSHNLTAVYGGSTTYAGSTSAVVVVTLR